MNHDDVFITILIIKQQHYMCMYIFTLTLLMFRIDHLKTCTPSFVFGLKKKFKNKEFLHLDSFVILWDFTVLQIVIYIFN